MRAAAMKHQEPVQLGRVPWIRMRLDLDCAWRPCGQRSDHAGGPSWDVARVGMYRALLELVRRRPRTDRQVPMRGMRLESEKEGC